MKFIHMADIHIGAIPDSTKPWSQERAKEIIKNFEQVIDKAEELQVEFLFIVGDLFHRQPLLRELKEINYKFKTLTYTQVVIIAGNHDYISFNSRYLNFQWSENVTFITDQEICRVCFEELGVEVYGMSYHTMQIKEDIYSNIKPDNFDTINILLIHGGDDKHIPFRKNELMDSGFDYIALGHIHKPQIFHNGKMAYSGSLEPIDKSETGKHGYILGEINKKGTNIQFICSAIREYIHLEIDCHNNMTNSEIQNILSRTINQYGKKNIYKIIINGFRDIDIEFDIDDIEKIGNIVEVEDNSIIDFDIEKMYMEYEDEVLGKFIYKMSQLKGDKELINKALYYGVRALLDK